MIVESVTVLVQLRFPHYNITYCTRAPISRRFPTCSLLVLPEEFLQRSEEHASLCECATYHRMALPDIKDIPQINQHRKTDGDDSQDTVDLGGPCARHKCSSGKQPAPPFRREFSVAELAETDITVNRDGHEENEWRIQEDKA